MERKLPRAVGDTADWRDEFDIAIDRLSKDPHAPAGMGEGAAYVHATLELAWTSARTIFGKAATPEVALGIYDRMAAEQKARSSA